MTWLIDVTSWANVLGAIQKPVAGGFAASAPSESRRLGWSAAGRDASEVVPAFEAFLVISSLHSSQGPVGDGVEVALVLGCCSFVVGAGNDLNRRRSLKSRWASCPSSIQRGSPRMPRQYRACRSFVASHRSRSCRRVSMSRCSLVWSGGRLAKYCWIAVHKIERARHSRGFLGGE